MILPLSISRLPSVSLFFESVVGDLADRINTVVCLPGRLPRELVIDGVTDACHRRRLHLVQWSIVTSDADVPGLLVSREFGLRCQTADPPEVVQAWSAKENSPDIVLLDAKTLSQVWIEFVHDLARELRRPTPSAPKVPVLCLIGVPSLGAELPERDVNFRFRWWWGVLSQCELRSLAQAAIADQQWSDARSRWTSAILSAGSVGDPSLFVELCSDPPTSIRAFHDSLSVAANAAGWNEDNLASAGAGSMICPSLIDAPNTLAGPPKGMRKLWALGALVNSVDEGSCLHSAALVAVKRFYELDHRVWREQVTPLFGWIDSIRVGFCERLTGRYKKGWSYRWVGPDNEIERQRLLRDDFSCEVRHIRQLLRENHIQEVKVWDAVLETMHNLRNNLAHGIPLELTAVETLEQKLNEAPPIRASEPRAAALLPALAGDRDAVPGRPTRVR